MNGKTDWVYPEELDQREAFWWSPDGRKIACLQFDERTVYRFPIIHELTADRKPAFETMLELERYPKAGKPYPTVKLFVIDLETKNPVEVGTESGPDVYITRIAWRKDGGELFFQRLNRLQNRLELKAANPTTGETRTILVEEEECYINLHEDFYQLGDNRHFIWSSERTGWKHLYLYDYSGKLIAPLTRGESEASAVSLVDEKNGWVYFTIQVYGGPSHRNSNACQTAGPKAQLGYIVWELDGRGTTRRGKNSSPQPTSSTTPFTPSATCAFPK